MFKLASSNQFGISDQTDVFVVDNNGVLNVAWVVGGGAWNGPVGISPPGLFPPGAAVTASNQFGIPNQTDVFVVDNNGVLNVAWVVGGGAWNGPVPIVNPAITLLAIEDNGRFIEVNGIKFTPDQTVTLDYLFKLQSDVNTSTFGTETLTSDEIGSFIFRIGVTLTDISIANVKATDVASGKTATALLEGV
jgi:hypothetical protein